jgi:hypothetical protein
VAEVGVEQLLFQVVQEVMVILDVVAEEVEVVLHLQVLEVSEEKVETV